MAEARENSALVNLTTGRYSVWTKKSIAGSKIRNTVGRDQNSKWTPLVKKILSGLIRGLNQLGFSVTTNREHLKESPLSNSS
jgi:hypothetical protein